MLPISLILLFQEGHVNGIIWCVNLRIFFFTQQNILETHPGVARMDASSLFCH